MHKPSPAQSQEYQRSTGGHGKEFRAEGGKDRLVEQPAYDRQEADSEYERHEYGRASFKPCLGFGFFAHRLILPSGCMCRFHSDLNPVPVSLGQTLADSLVQPDSFGLDRALITIIITILEN
jgi:hypothetical protein